MPSRRRTKWKTEVSEIDRTEIKKSADQLVRSLDKTRYYLKHFCEVGEAVGRFRSELKRMLNVVAGRPADYEEPPEPGFFYRLHQHEQEMKDKAE